MCFFFGYLAFYEKYQHLQQKTLRVPSHKYSAIHSRILNQAQKKYGSIDGVYQEKEGPEVAKEI